MPSPPAPQDPGKDASFLHHNQAKAGKHHPHPGDRACSCQAKSVLPQGREGPASGRSGMAPALSLPILTELRHSHRHLRLGPFRDAQSPRPLPLVLPCSWLCTERPPFSMSQNAPPGAEWVSSGLWILFSSVAVFSRNWSLRAEIGSILFSPTASSQA